MACDSSCPSRCKGPSADDCLFETCSEMQAHYPLLAAECNYATLYLNGAITPAVCEPDGWMTIISSDKSVNFSSMTLSDYQTTGQMGYLHFNMFMALSTV